MTFLSHSFPGLVVGGGRVQFDDPAALRALLRNLGGARVVLTVELERDLSANAAYWGRIVGGFMDLGWEKLDAHRALKRRFLPIHQQFRNRCWVQPGSSAHLTERAFREYVEQSDRLLAHLGGEPRAWEAA